MNYRIVKGSVTYGADTILEEINFEIRNKEKIAIVGRKCIFINMVMMNI